VKISGDGAVKISGDRAAGNHMEEHTRLGCSCRSYEEQYPEKHFMHGTRIVIKWNTTLTEYDEYHESVDKIERNAS